MERTPALKVWGVIKKKYILLIKTNNMDKAVVLFNFNFDQITSVVTKLKKDKFISFDHFVRFLYIY